jgi:hypothetical protein
MKKYCTLMHINKVHIIEVCNGYNCSLVIYLQWSEMAVLTQLNIALNHTTGMSLPKIVIYLSRANCLKIPYALLVQCDTPAANID